MKTTLRHAKIELVLHTLREGEGRALLLLHGLGESAAREDARWYPAWPGPIHALDFTGHGESTIPVGGGYAAEFLMADADAALAHLGAVTLCGRGLGAYVALLLAGSRPAEVTGAILCDGPGLAGGGSQPSTPTLPGIDPSDTGPPDPFALVELARDLRPTDYALEYVRQVEAFSALDRPLTVCAVQRPEWLQAVVDTPSVAEAPLDDALAYYARL